MEEDDEVSYYSILNVPREAKLQDIKKAYRTLAAVFHPDKHTDAALKQQAEVTFAKLQEAHEILSDPQKRLVYDVYGKQGLVAGFEVGDKLEGREELKQKWEKFQQKQQEEREESRSAHRGYYCCRVDARDLIRLRQPRYPLIRSIVAQNALYGPGLEDDSYYVQGSVNLRQAQAGVGTVIAGYKRELSPHDSLEGSVAVGLQTLLTLTSHRQLSPYDQGTLSATYSTSEGLGLQLTATRQLLSSTQGNFAWVLGPSSSAGMSVSVSHRTKKFVVTSKLEIGAIHAASIRLSYLATQKTSLRLTARLGVTGADVELGVAHRLSAQALAMFSAVVGLQGVWVKAQYKRGGHTFEFPIWLTEDPRQWQVAVAAHLLPPVAGWLTMRYVVRPVKTWQRRRKEAAERKAKMSRILDELAKAVGEQALLLGPALRKAGKETERNGLVIITAVYGVLEEYWGEWAGRDVAEVRGRVKGVLEGAGEAGGSGGEATAAVEGAVETAVEATAPVSTAVAQWIEVGIPLQYHVQDGKLEMLGETQKSGLMGFADLAPSADKQLYIAYWYKGVVYEVTVGDDEGVALPGAGSPVSDESRRAVMQQALENLGLGGQGGDAPEGEAVGSSSSEIS